MLRESIEAPGVRATAERRLQSRLALQPYPASSVSDLKDELKTGTLHAMCSQLGIRVKDL
jgi:hypothetical protein